MFRNLILSAGAAVLTLIVPLACATVAGFEPRDVLIVYTGNTLGELKPCGCAKEEDQGGIERRMGYLLEVRAREKNLLLVDTGDNFKEPSRQGKLKAQTLMTALDRMGYDAIALGEHDLVYGNRFLREQDTLPWVMGNLESEKLPPARLRIKRLANGLKTAVIAVADPDLFYSASYPGLEVRDPKAAVERMVKELNASEKPDLIVLLTHMSREKALGFLDLDGVDVVVNGHIEKDTDAIDMEPVIRGGKILVQPGPRGQKMGELRVHIAPGGGKTFEQRMVRLDSSVKFDPEMVTLYEEYNAKVEEIFFASRAARKKKSGGKIFAADTACKTCHPGPHKIWAESRHGHAYSTLRKINKAFDPECLVCHVVGFNRPGGFVSEVDTPDLKNVQCEQCHGPGLEHARAPASGFGKDAASACASCHVKNHSPRFNYETYWPKIKH